MPENLSGHIYSQSSTMSVRLLPLFTNFNKNPEHEIKLHKENKQVETELKLCLVAHWLSLPRKK